MAFAWAAFGVAFFHTILPVHWLPYVAAARADRWTWSRLLKVTAAGTAVHLASTALLTLLVVLLSHGLARFAGQTGLMAGSLLLILLALAYLLAPAWLERRNRQMAWLLAAGVGIQPCAELIPVLLIASTGGPMAVVAAAATWAATVPVVSLALVSAGFWGLRWNGLDRAMPFVRAGAGCTILISGILSLWHGH